MRTLLTTLHAKFIHNSLALPCLAAYCGNECGDLLIREFTTHEPHESILASILAEQPDVVGFSVYLWNRRETLDLVDALAVAKPELKILLGGPEVSFEDDNFLLKHPGLIALIHGEGEEPLRALLSAWEADQEPENIPRVSIRTSDGIINGPDSPPLTTLDDIPSPFTNGFTDLSRGFVYYETSRGCPYKCSFCLSAREDHVRSYSMERIKSDLMLLMEKEVAKIKLVDRTFNYDAKRAREIFRFILANNRSSHFHFEIGAHLLDTETLDLLASIPKDIFQFEIGVQSTLKDTLNAIERKVDLERLEANVKRLLQDDKIHLHLDLIAGLPGEGYNEFLSSIDRVINLKPHHLQIEPVKLLPGSPLREQASELGIRFDPNPPYTVLGSAEMSFEEIQRFKEFSRLLDITYNSGHFATFLSTLTENFGSFSEGLTWLADEWLKKDLFRFPMNRQTVFDKMVEIVRPHQNSETLVESLAYDYALCERVVTNRIPDFFDINLSADEQHWVKEKVQRRIEEIKGQGIKLQYFAARFKGLTKATASSVIMFLYLTQTGKKMIVEEYRFK
jgi:anaerobic magnesium-protoporphyrin IX monomethyl ester cyclase